MIILVLHPWSIIREGLRQVLILELGESTELLEPRNLDQAQRWVNTYRPGLALVHPRAYPGCVSGLAPDIPVIVYTENTSVDSLTQAIRDGASGFVNVQDDLGRLFGAIESVNRGVPVFTARHVSSVTTRLIRIHQEYLRAPTPLSRQEVKVLGLLARGHTNAEIAEDLVISIRTVKSTVNRIYTKLGVRNRVEATLRALGAGLVSHRR